MAAGRKPFWQEKTLARMSRAEWESLCDGCGKCCLHKLEDEDSGEIFFTRLACRLLDIEACRCTRYRQRCAEVEGCLDLRAGFTQFHWLPSTCAYRLLADDTIEQKIRTLQREKAALAGSIVREESLAKVLDLASLRNILG